MEERKRKLVVSLDEQLAGFQRSRLIREYLQEVRRVAVAAHGKIDPGSELDLWLTWAEGQADRCDPLIRRRTSYPPPPPPPLSGEE